jgi:hypothetical protein
MRNNAIKSIASWILKSIEPEIQIKPGVGAFFSRHDDRPVAFKGQKAIAA